MSSTDLAKLRFLYKLKSCYRYASVDSRHESVAEHSWSCLVLADCFISKFPQSIDRLKVYELLMYHDVIELATGDTPINPDIDDANKIDNERKNIDNIVKQLPDTFSQKYQDLFSEFLDQKTLESQFACAIDALDAEIHEMDYKQDWVGWSKEFLLNKKLHLFDQFPDMRQVFLELVDFLVVNNFFDH